MIRLCPLPYSLSNGAISTFNTISPFNFALATALATPKLLVHVFIGSRLAALAGEDMDASTKAINWASIVFGTVLGLGVGWWVYKRTQARAKQLEAEERAKIGSEGRRAGGNIRGTEARGGAGLEHPDAFLDDLDDETELESGRLRDAQELDDEVDFEWGDDGDEPYADEPSPGREEREIGMGNGKVGR